MRIPGSKRLRLSARWLRSRFVNHGLVLGYHRIAEVSADPFSMCVTPRHFAEQLAVLRKCAQPVPLTELVQRLDTRTLPERAVAITFDDGYKDHLYQAKPLLEKYQVPATVFVTTGYLGRDFWWSELERMLLTCPGEFPTHLALSINGKKLDWTRNHAAPSRANMTAEPYRLNLLRSLHGWMLRLQSNEQQSVLAQLREWTGVDLSTGTSGTALDLEELVQLATGEYITIGAHSVTHPFLDTLSPAMQQFEVQESKAFLERLLGCTPSGFSYPNGAASNCTRSIVRKAGFSFACASHNDVSWRNTNRFSLPRFWIPDWDGETFSRWLLHWISGSSSPMRFYAETRSDLF